MPPRLKILGVGYRVPVPVRDGGNVRAHGYLRELGRRHDVHYLCRADRPAPEAEQALSGLCRSAEIFADPQTVDWKARLRSLGGGFPLGVITPAHAFFRRVRDVLARGSFDLVYPMGADAGLLAAAAVATTPVVWDLCDCTSRYYDRQARREGSPIRALWYRAQASRYRRLERTVLGRDLAVVVASPSEATALRGGNGGGADRIHVLPTGVHLPALTVPSADRPSLVFTGTLSYPPNADAVRHFCRDVWPTIRRERPDVRLAIVGDGASRELVSACGVASGVEFLGFVPDVFEVLQRATLFVCPMRQGTGIKVKLLEAMACGLPAVASPIAVEGMPDARDGVHLRVARSAEDFARDVVTLLGDKEERARLGAHGRELAAGYAWDRLGERLDRLCREEVARRLTGAGVR